MIIYEFDISIEKLRNREYPTMRDGINTSLVDDNNCPIQPENISVEGYINENPKYGEIDKSNIFLQIPLNQTTTNVGIYSDFEFIESKLLSNGEPIPCKRKTGLPVENYYTFDEHFVTGLTESQLFVVQSYNNANPYIIGNNMSNNPSKFFSGVIEIKTNSIVYVIGGDLDTNGIYVNNTGVVYETFNQFRRVYYEQTDESKDIPLTTFKYFTKGYREDNTQLSAIVKDEKLYGITQKPSVDSDLFVDRGNVNVYERHLKLSEIKSMGHLIRYGNGFYNVQSI